MSRVIEPQPRLITMSASHEVGAQERREEFEQALLTKLGELGFTSGQDVFVHCSVLPPSRSGGDAKVLAKVTLSAAACLRRANAMDLHDFLDGYNEKSDLPDL